MKGKSKTGNFQGTVNTRRVDNHYTIAIPVTYLIEEVIKITKSGYHNGFLVKDLSSDLCFSKQINLKTLEPRKNKFTLKRTVECPS